MNHPGPASERQAQLDAEEEPAAAARGTRRGGGPRMQLGPRSGGDSRPTKGSGPRMQLSDEEVEAKLAKMQGSSGKPPERAAPGPVLGLEALEVGVVLVPLLAIALFSLEEYVRARL